MSLSPRMSHGSPGQAHANPRSASSGGGGGNSSVERERPVSSSTDETRFVKTSKKLPKALKTQLAQLLKVLGMIANVLEQR